MNTLKTILLETICISTLIALFICAFFYAASPSVWYANTHDSHCETLNGASTCHCYERLLAIDPK